jgi:hypothetical protein
MTKFDFISVLVSIVFGLGLTHLCGGAFHLAYRRQLGAVSFLLAGFTFVVIVLNWWTFFAWHGRTNWTFEALLVLVAWALSFYAMAFALFPPGTETTIDSETRHRGFAIALLVTLVLDVFQTALLGTLFEPWYYLPFVGQYALCAIVIHRTTRRPVRKAVAWWMVASVLLWSLFVRRHLGG